MSKLHNPSKADEEAQEHSSHHRPKPDLRLFAVALLMGAVVALSTLLLIEAIAVVQQVLIGYATERHFATLLNQTPTWRVLLAPTLGGLAVGVLIGYLPDKRYHGVADVMEACALRGGRMNVRSGLGAAAAAAISIGSGASVGREGPAVHIGASICAWIAEKMGLNRRHSLILLGCGAAAAVTASFNAPIAGVLFALEVVVGYYTLRVFAPIVLSALGAVTVVHFVVGDSPTFILPSYAVESLWELPWFALIGVVAALVVMSTIRGVRLVQLVHHRFKVPVWLRPALGGLVIGIIALITPYALGVGYQTISLSLNEAFPLSILLGILLAKMVAIALSLGSGFCGGVFSPSLVLGALSGAAVGQICTMILPGEVSSPSVYAMAGMAASASAMLGAPISTVLIVFELTSNYNAIIAVMLGSAIACTTMMYWPYSSYFRWQLSQRGVNIVAGRDQSLMRTETVDSIISQRYTLLSSDDPVQRAIARCARERQEVMIATDHYGALVASATVVELVAELEDENQLSQFIAYAHDQSLSLLKGSSLSGALDVMTSHQTHYLPVVEIDSEERHQVAGVVYQTDLLKKYNKLLEQARADEFGVN